MVRNKKEVMEIQLENVDIPRARDLADLLQEWIVWVKTYGDLIGMDDKIISLYQRSREAALKWGRDG